MARKKNRKKELRHQVREENSPSMECKVDIKEGETYFAHIPIQQMNHFSQSCKRAH